MGKNRANSSFIFLTFTLFLFFIGSFQTVFADDLEEIQKRGVLRHLGIPYANFVTGSGDGLSVEMMKYFARYLGLRYEYVETSWKNAFSDLSGRQYTRKGNKVEISGITEVRGDILANGLTIIPWRKQLIDYSTPVFPSGVWFIARSDSSLNPIVPSGEIESDIRKVKSLLKDQRVLTVKGTCIDADLHGIRETGARVVEFNNGKNLNELIPVLLNDEADGTLLDVPDALVGLRKWPGQVKVIGPISSMQKMGVGFAKTSPLLRAKFNEFFRQFVADGTYQHLVEKYFPDIFFYHAEFFDGLKNKGQGS